MRMRILVGTAGQRIPTAYVRTHCAVIENASMPYQLPSQMYRLSRVSPLLPSFMVYVTTFPSICAGTLDLGNFWGSGERKRTNQIWYFSKHPAVTDR